ncbi:hypothetical protein N7530_008789 [Penicillium desertorum]|uniref:Uncharacterized protein n=1 Tax=Penicillium desertorum TaxID=1303715 RepID=A0A9W9WPR6_9EURO|nr:hypothetical protein N7530_008789 [Penicillium desertorum]
MTPGFSRMTSKLGMENHNMRPLQDTVARLRRIVVSALAPTITPGTIWKFWHNNNRKLLDYFSYPKGITECQILLGA